MIKTKVTIGIPAYNEEANIGHLLNALLKQKTKNFVISKIIVVSDKSTDNTNDVVNNIKDKRIEFILNKKRLGQAECQNIITKKSNTNILILLNADVLPTSSVFVEKISSAIVNNKADLVAAKVKPVKPTTKFEKMLYTSYEFKNKIFEELENGDNLYTCNGRARAFSKKFYKKLNFKYSPHEDAYSFLACLKYGFVYKYTREARVVYVLPKNWKDHSNQSLRFLKSKNYLYRVFGKKFVLDKYKIPTILFFKHIQSRLIEDPLTIILYLLTFLAMKVVSFFTREIDNLWLVPESTKTLK